MIKFRVFEVEKLFYFYVLANSGKPMLCSESHLTKETTLDAVESLWFKIAKAQDNPDVQGCTAARFEVLRPIPYTADSLKRP